jgi:hypothetical protein
MCHCRNKVLCTKEAKVKRFISVGFQLFVVAASFLCLTVGCMTESGTGMTPTATYIVPVTSEPDPLDGLRWELVEFGGGPCVPEQPKLFVKFEEGALRLQGGCNRISGHYLIENDHITITFVKRTEVDYPDLEKIEEVVYAFSNAMPAFESYAIEDDWLRIRYADGELLFRRVSE